MQLSSHNLEELSRCAIMAATKAGLLIASYANKEVAVKHKDGGDNIASQVVTEVDLKSEAIIVEMLQPTLAQYNLALLTEERADDRARLEKGYFWCVDPMDGTLSFIESQPGYAVSIALVSRAGIPVIGVIYDPVTQTLYSAVKGQGAFRNGEPWVFDAAVSPGRRPLTLACDRSLVKQSYYPELIQRLESLAGDLGLNGLRTRHTGGAAMNACWVLENAPACYFKCPKPVEGGGSLWDFAATATIFHELGVVASDVYGQPLDLNRADSTFMNHRGVLFATDQALAVEVQALLALCSKGGGSS